MYISFLFLILCFKTLFCCLGYNLQEKTDEKILTYKITKSDDEISQTMEI